MDPNVLAGYAGTYELAPGVNILITLEGKQLSEKLGAQAAFPIFPESERMFFLKVVDAQIEFEKDASGVVTDLVSASGRARSEGGADQRETGAARAKGDFGFAGGAGKVCGDLRTGAGSDRGHDRRRWQTDDADHGTAEI